jgi:RNA polymerase sigma-70 factor (ECF subfamily)
MAVPGLYKTPSDYEGLDDRELTLAFQQGERGDAYDAIYRRYGPRVTSVCRRMLGDPDDVQEASQEAFLRVYQTLGTFNGRYQLGAWISRIATNVCLDRIRARSRKPSQATPWEVLDLEVASGHEHEDPEEFHLRRTEGRRVRRVLASLPPMHRAAIVLRDFEGLSYADVANALDITECQVKALIHRARCSFKRSWTTSVAALLPWRIFDRFRQIDMSAKEQTTQVMASGSQMAASCAGIMQTCGQLLGERVGPAMAALLMGTAGAAAAAQPVLTQAPEPTPSVRAASASPAVNPGGQSGGARNRATTKAALSESGTASPPSESSSSPSPSPSPTPSPSSSPSTGGAVTPSPSPTPGPPPPWGFFFASSVSSASQCGCAFAPDLESSEVSGKTSGGITFRQDVRGVVYDAESDPAWRLRIDYSGSARNGKGTFSTNFLLGTQGGEHGYSASGALASTTTGKNGGTVYVYSGTYHRVGGPSTDAPIPRRGTFDATVRFWGDGVSLYDVGFSLREG